MMNNQQEENIVEKDDYYCNYFLKYIFFYIVQCL